MTEVAVRPLGGGDHEALRAFFLRVPEGDRTFFREDVLAEGVIERWTAGADGERFLAVRDGDVVGYLTLITGVGRALARHGLLVGLDRGLTKLVVEVVADQEPTLAMFSALGFEAEALLRDHVRDGTGQLRDLIVMAHFVEATWDAMRTIGLDDALSS